MGTLHTSDSCQRDGGVHTIKTSYGPQRSPWLAVQGHVPEAQASVSSSHGPSILPRTVWLREEPASLPSTLAWIPIRVGDPHRGGQGPESAIAPAVPQTAALYTASESTRPSPQAKVKWNEISPFASSHVYESVTPLPLSWRPPL